MRQTEVLTVYLCIWNNPVLSGAREVGCHLQPAGLHAGDVVGGLHVHYLLLHSDYSVLIPEGSVQEAVCRRHNNTAMALIAGSPFRGYNRCRIWGLGPVLFQFKLILFLTMVYG